MVLRLFRRLPWWLAVAALAQQPRPSEPITVDALVAEALENNPEVRAAQRRVEAAMQRPSQASSLPDPMFSVQSNSINVPLPGWGLGSQPVANLGVMASQAVPAPGKLKLRSDLAYKDIEIERQQFHAAELAVTVRVKTAFYKLQYAQMAHRILEKNRDLLQQILRVTEARYTVGKAAQQDLFKAQTQLSVLATRLLRLEQEARAARLELGTAVGHAVDGAVAGDLKPFAMVETIDDLARAADEHSPQLARERKSIQKSEVAVNLARKDYSPDYNFSAGYYTMGSMGSMYMLRADVSVPLFYNRKQRPAVAEAVTNMRQARSMYQAADQALRLRIQDDYLALTTADKLLRIYSETVIPQSALALESSLASYETGAVDFLSVLSNFTSVFEFEMNYADELRNLYLAAVRLEEAAGKKLIP